MSTHAALITEAATAVPLSVDEILRLLPIAAEGLGWRSDGAEPTERGRFSVRVVGRDGVSTTVTVWGDPHQGRWTELRMTDLASGPAGQDDLVLRTVMLMALEARLRLVGRRAQS